MGDLNFWIKQKGNWPEIIISLVSLRRSEIIHFWNRFLFIWNRVNTYAMYGFSAITIDKNKAHFLANLLRLNELYSYVQQNPGLEENT